MSKLSTVVLNLAIPMFFSYPMWAIDASRDPQPRSAVNEERSVSHLKIIDKNHVTRASCTGVFISDRALLTATHCLQKSEADFGAVYFTDVASGNNSVHTEVFCLNEKNKICEGVDILLIQFPPETYTGPVWPLQLIRPWGLAGYQSKAFGFGLHDGSNSVDGILRRSGGETRVYQEKIRQNGPLLSMRNGDSGGPLIDEQDRLMGIYTAGPTSMSSDEDWSYLVPTNDLKEREKRFKNWNRIAAENGVSSVECRCLVSQGNNLKKTAKFFQIPFTVDRAACKALELPALAQNDLVRIEACQ